MKTPDPSGPGPDHIHTLSVMDLVKFINEQPDDRPLKMWNNVNHNTTCGCLLVQYGKHIGLSFMKYSDAQHAYVDRLSQPIAHFDSFVWYIFDAPPTDKPIPPADNYAQLRSHLKTQYRLP